MEQPHSSYKVRIVTATSLFDGHDAAINIMRRIMQQKGVEVIHMGHNRSVDEIVRCAIQEDAQGIALTSYQGGHSEFLKYMYDLLKTEKADIKIVGGGGGTILPKEIEALHKYGITRLYSPDDGRAMGLVGMIEDVIAHCDFDPLRHHQFSDPSELSPNTPQSLAKYITLAENQPQVFEKHKKDLRFKISKGKAAPILGITGTGGAGKSSLVDEFIRRFLLANPQKTVAIISVDPTKRKSGGALLGDRIRMNSVSNDRVYMRSLATRQSNAAMSPYVQDALLVCQAAGFDLVILESSGIGQSDTAIMEYCDGALYVMTSEYGAATQLEKIDMLDYADFVAVNKFEKNGALDALRDVRKQYKRNHQLWDTPDEELPIVGTIASQFNDEGINRLYDLIVTKLDRVFAALQNSQANERLGILPPERQRYLSEIVSYNRQYHKFVEAESKRASEWYQLEGAWQLTEEKKLKAQLHQLIQKKKDQLSKETLSIIENWEELKEKYSRDVYSYQVRGKEIRVPMFHNSLSNSMIPRVVLPKFRDWGDIVRWRMLENMPGRFPYAAGVYPFKRQGERPTRMFAGEGGPERTNKRFHYLSLAQPAKRLSTAFDSVTLYGEDPASRPDIYGKVGNSGVSISTLDDAKILYSGFELADPATSVSMTINGPAPIILAFFLNAAIDQQCEKHLHAIGKAEEVQKKIAELHHGAPPHYRDALPQGNDGLGLLLLGTSGDQFLEREVYEKIKAETLHQVRGTVQADILKEDQAQNTCIFSTEFALRMMGDIQAYFVEEKVRNFYSVSISGYHIAEAGANPITQLAFTLANGFTYIEYYLSRGMHIDDFAPNLSFFFSNGIDPEYAVIGRVARRIWAKALRHYYKGNERSQMLKYHIQTSGRSLHAQEITFNDIRTTLQALYAVYDNCNSLHTNAYDEAITTPTEESVRRAVAIQLIITEELGLAKNENPLQGSFIIEELSDLVEEAVLAEFERLSDRGGVLGAMERMYQRSKIQEESMQYEHQKHNGEIPIIGVNTFLDPKGSPTVIPEEVIRATESEKDAAIASLKKYQEYNRTKVEESLENLQATAMSKANLFHQLMETSKYASLGQITHSLYEVGGKYRRNM